MMGEIVIFGGLTLLAMGSALLMIVQWNPIYSALFLILTFFAQAGLFVLLNAPFIAAVHVLINAGAVMVLFLFIIMLLDLRRDGHSPTLSPSEKGRPIVWVPRDRIQLTLGVTLAVVFLVEMALTITGSSPPPPIPSPFKEEGGDGEAIGNTQLIGRLLFTDFLFPFEVTSVILLVAIVGAMVLAKRRLD